MELRYRLYGRKKMKQPKPRNIPRTELDCIKARSEGRNEGYKYVLLAATYVLINDLGFNDFQLNKFSQRLTKTCEMVAEGRINLKDVEKSLKDEHDLTIELI